MNVRLADFQWQLESPELPIAAIDLLCSRSVEDARGTTQRLLFQYGELMQYWPDLIAARVDEELLFGT